MLIEDFVMDLKIPFDTLLIITNKMYKDFFDCTCSEIRKNPKDFVNKVFV